MDVNAIKSDVAEFAAQLGLASGGSGFDDRDFRTPPKPKQPKPTADAEDSKSNKENSKEQTTGKGKGHVKGNKFKPEVPGLKDRTWKESVGPRPAKTTTAPVARPPGQSFSRVGLNQVIDKLLDGTPWHEQLADMSELKEPTGKKGKKKGEGVSEEKQAELVKAARATAESILERLAKAYEQEHERNDPADAKWLQTVRRSGTTADKLAAWTVVIQENLPANMRSLDAVLNMSTGKGKRQAAQAVEVLCELFAGAVLPERKLLHLFERPLHLLAHGAVTGDVTHSVTHEDVRRLVYWHVEDALKTSYARFVETLGTASKDSLEHLKDKAMKASKVLLAAKPEQERALLRTLVNKLGDPSRKVASKGGYLLSQLLEEHPAMGAVVAREVEAFMFRPGLPNRARYTGIIFLNQITLKRTERDQVLAGRLIH
eukprot:CAMPEP_0118950608 /NCGR_PEP_ID=MMETSP1169-20130426/51692_1 /TAXON_ID=36882 /ORGANISM="Pyramimonas obovata, Strain CCMP722" /LENGTH=428 /DNA_ID=CAMNT_0006897491 /DNA_START=18 /DNA_END=1301 /DNA_ORIENTATION=-